MADGIVSDPTLHPPGIRTSHHPTRPGREQTMLRQERWNLALRRRQVRMQRRIDQRQQEDVRYTTQSAARSISYTKDQVSNPVRLSQRDVLHGAQGRDVLLFG